MCEFNVALDKGTYDAISLNPDEAKTKRQRYKTNVVNMLQSNGLLIITSCNWTDQELIQDFETRKSTKIFMVNPWFKQGQMWPTNANSFFKCELILRFSYIYLIESVIFVLVISNISLVILF